MIFFTKPALRSFCSDVGYLLLILSCVVPHFSLCGTLSVPLFFYWYLEFSWIRYLALYRYLNFLYRYFEFSWIRYLALYRYLNLCIGILNFLESGTLNFLDSGTSFCIGTSIFLNPVPRFFCIGISFFLNPVPYFVSVPSLIIINPVPHSNFSDPGGGSVIYESGTSGNFLF